MTAVRLSDIDEALHRLHFHGVGQDGPTFWEAHRGDGWTPGFCSSTARGIP